MATTKKKKTSARRPRKMPERARASASHQAKASSYKAPLLIIGALVLAASVVSILFRPTQRPSAPAGETTLPPARKAASQAAPGAEPPSPSASTLSPGGLPLQKRASAPEDAMVWDRASSKKQPEFRIVRSDSGSAEVRIFKKGNKSVRLLKAGPGAEKTVSLFWDGKDEGGRSVAAGTYYVRISGAHGDMVEEIVIK
jgi:hypothetical protein